MPSLSLFERVRGRLRRDLLEPLEHGLRAPLRRRWNARRSYQPVFVTGASGSGTSLMAVSLGQHFDCAGVVYESNMQISSRSPLYVPEIESFSSVSSYERHLTPDPSWSVDDVRRDSLDMYRAYAWGHSDVIIDKGPDTHLFRAAFLERCFKDARYVVIFRDPVASLEGLRRKWRPFFEASLDECIRFYRRAHERFLTDLASADGRVVAVEYERFVQDSAATLSRLGRELLLAPTRRRRRLRSYPNVEGRGLRNVRGSEIGVVRDASERARARLAPKDVERIEAELGPLREHMRRLPFTVTSAP